MAAASAFSLHANPFAVLGATPRTPLDELQALAGQLGTPAAAAAARALSVPRSRLPAELAFLPGAADAAPIVLGALANGMRPDPAILPPAARANVLAHLCATGAATEGEQDRLAVLQPPPGDPALADAIDADRALAGIPPVQRPAMAPEQDALADRHAAALVASCQGGPDPAARLAALVRAAPDGTPAAFMRRAAAAWARQSAGELARLEEDTGDAEREALRNPKAGSTARFVAAMKAWAALTAPQRASDARAGLDNAAALRMVRTWRSAGIRLAEKGFPELALPLARAMAAFFADLPGESARLAEDVRDCAGRVEEHGLEVRLAPLRALVERLTATPAALASLDANLVRAPFGPGAPGTAGELWAAFDAAAGACVQSEAPWTILRDLATRLGGEHKVSGASAALSLQRGMAARADAAGFTDLAARLRAGERGLEGAAAIWRYLDAADKAKKPWQGGFRGRRRTLAALRAALLLVDDPAGRATLQADEAKIKRSGRVAIAGWAVLAAVVLAIVGVMRLDQSYSDNAPYRRAAPQSLPGGGTNPDFARGVMPDAQPAPAPAPFPTLPQPSTLQPKEPEARFGGAKDPVPPASAPVPRLAFPTRTVLPEKQPPRNVTRVRTLPEVRWCENNKVRLQAALDAANNVQEPAVRALNGEWDAVCDTYPNYRRDEERVAAEVERFHDRLEAEGRAMLEEPHP